MIIEHQGLQLLFLTLQRKCTLQNGGRLFLRLLFLLFRLRRRKLEGFRLAVFSLANLLPNTRATLKVTEGLGELQRLRDNALPLLIISDLGVASQWEVLAKRVALETVVGHDSAQIGVAGEVDAVQIVDFALVPVCAVKETSDTGDSRGFVGVGLDSDARVVADREQVVHDLEALVAGGIIGGSNGADLGEFGSGIVWDDYQPGFDLTCMPLHEHLRKVKVGTTPDGEM